MKTSLSWHPGRSVCYSCHVAEALQPQASQLLDDANAACDLLSERLDTFSEHLNSSSGSWEQVQGSIAAETPRTQ